MDSDRCSCRIVHEDKVELARRLALDRAIAIYPQLEHFLQQGIGERADAQRR